VEPQRRAKPAFTGIRRRMVVPPVPYHPGVPEGKAMLNGSLVA
jgi:hypothetical protein